MEEKKDIFYVGIEEPDTIRASLLDAQTSLSESLRRYENFKDIRKERAENIEQFKRDVKEILKLFLILKEKLPDVELKLNNNLPIIKEPQKKLSPQPSSAAKPQPAQPFKPKFQFKESIKKQDGSAKENLGLEKLKTELNDVEEKLNSLF